MDHITWSAIIAGIALIVSVSSPLITSILNNHHEKTMSEQKFFNQHRAETIENFIKYTGALSKHSATSENFQQYGQCSKEIYLYIPEQLWQKVDNINNHISKCDYETAADLLSDFCKCLKQYPPRSKKYKRNH